MKPSAWKPQYAGTIKQFLDSAAGQYYLQQLLMKESDLVVEADNAQAMEQIKIFNRFSGVRWARDQLVRLSVANDK